MGNHKAQDLNKILLLGGFLIVKVCLVAVFILQYLAIVRSINIEAEVLAIFTHIATLVCGYLFGRNK